MSHQGRRRFLKWVPRGARTWTALVLLACVAIGVWAVLRTGVIRRVYIYSDRSVVKESGTASRVRSVLWSPPREVPATPAAEWTPEGRGDTPPRPGNLHSTGTVFFSVKTPDRGFELQARELTPGGWSAPFPLEDSSTTAGDAEELHRINTPYDEINPCLSPDGSTLFFASNRPAGLGGFDLYRCRRLSGAWGPPRNLGARVNSPYDDCGAALHPSQTVLVFSTNRPRTFLLVPPADWSDILLDSWAAGRHALAVCAVPAGPDDSWAEARPLPDLDGNGSDRDPCFAPSGDFLYFSSDRAGGHGGYDLYRAGILTEPSPGEARVRLSSPENLDQPPNSPFDETEPRLFLDGFALAYDASDPRHDSHVTLETRTREVETGLELASIPLRAIARNISRVGLVVLFGLLLSLSVVLLLRYRRAWEFNLLARCGVLAVLFHALLFYAFYFWVVSDEIVALARKEVSAEVSVEKLLAAKISLAANKIEIRTPETTQPGTEAVSLARKIEMPSLSASREPSPLVVDVSVPALLPVPEPAIDRPETVPEAQPPPLADVSRVLPPPQDRTVHPLPAPDKVEVPAEPPGDLTSQAEASIQAGLEMPRPGPIGAVEETAPQVDELPEVAMVEIAKTQVQSPTRKWDVLPPTARPLREPSPVVATLPVVQQTPEEALEETLPGTDPVPRTITEREPPPVKMTAPEALEVRTTELASEVDRWRSLPAGAPPLPTPAPDARELPEVPLRPQSAPPPMQGSSVRLPEAVPLAEVARDASDDSAGGELRPRPSERHRQPAGRTGDRAQSLLSSPDLVVRAAPRTAPAESDAPVTASVAALLHVRSRPGATAPLPQAELPAVPGPPPPPPPRPHLPEAGEAGKPGDTGAEEVADLLPPPGPRVTRATFSSSSSPPARPRDTAELSAAASLPQISASVGPAVLRSTPERGAPALPPPTAETTKAPELALVTPAHQRLPEAPPELQLSSDLGTLRSAPVRRTLLRETGGSDKTEAAVALALEWLARHQSRGGHWDVDHFDDRCQGCRSPGFLVHCDAALTGLALLCFLGQNHSPANTESPYRRNVRAAMEWLLAGQDAAGCFARGDLRYTMYTHGIVTLALSEAYTLTKDRTLLAPLTRASRLIVESQNRTTGGWRYKPRPPLRGDTSITGWQVLALTSLRGAGVELPEAVFDRARHWLDEEVSSGTHGGIYGYSRPDEPRVAMVAEGMYARLLLGATRTDRNIEEAARYIHTETRGGTHLDNFYLLYYGNLALYNYQGWIWDAWNTEVRGFLTRTQHRTGPLAGSWDPNGPWSETGGRVLSTCLATLSLEVYYRYLPLYWRGAPGKLRTTSR